jgi:SprB repeat/Secretion system C-terminal sorting domain
LLTITDANLCTATSSMTITASTALNLVVTPTSVRCNGGNTGSALATLSGGVQPYTYAWTSGGTTFATTASVTGLTAGNYLLTVLDAVGCSSSQVVTITQPASISTFLDVRDAVCANNTGAVLASSSVTGGTQPYSYLWNTGATTLPINNLTAGTYSLTVTDNNGCTRVSTTTVNYFAPPTVSLTPTDVSCNGGNTGAITASATGGTAPLSYAWSNSATNSTITGLTAGTYTVTVTDSKGCTAVRSVTLTQPAAIAITPTVVSATCLPIGSISVVATGGATPYTYRWSNGATTSSITGLAGGSFTVTVTDANSCSNTLVITVPATTSPNLSCSIVQTKAISAQGVGDGEALVTPINGRSPYTYRWSNNGTLATGVFLFAGVNSVTVTDANGCTTTCSITLTQPICNALIGAGTISGEQTFCNTSELTGIFEISPAVGGSGTIEYLWMYSDVSPVFNAGWYPVPGATGKDLPANLLPAITRATHFIRCVRRAGCAEYIEGNTITKTPIVILDYVGERFPCVNSVRTYTAADNGAGATYQWIFQGANISTSSSRSVNVTFTSTGLKTVTLTISKAGCSLTKTIQIDVSNCLLDYGTLFAFSVSSSGSNGVKLNWATTGENKASKYIIEKSVDNVNFDVIGTVASQNLPNNLYSFADPKPKMGRAFYRIHQMTLANDEVMLSKVQKITIADKGQAVVTYPNPVGATLFVEVVDADNAEGTIEIYNSIGALIKTQQFTANQMRYEVNTEGLGKGNYILKIRKADGSVSTTKISKF